MTENTNKFDKGAATIQKQAHVAGLKKAAVAVNLRAEFMARGVDVHDEQNVGR